MGRAVWVGGAIVVACGLATGLWVGLQYVAGVDLAVASGAAGTLFAGLTTIGAAVLPSPKSARTVKRHPTPNTGTLNGVTSIFADRSGEWAAIRSMVRGATKHGRTQAAIMIHGMPGAGKTEFARHAALRFVKEYSRRALRADVEVLACEVDLKGYEGVARAKPEDILPQLLGPDAVDQRRSAMTLDDLAGEWRKHLQDKFLVLVLDNAADEGQVRPFLPGGSQYIVLVTGRRMLTGLIDRLESFPLDVLDPAGARQMMRNMVRRSLAENDEKAMREIAQICECLPQALKEATAKVACTSGFSFSDKLAELNGSPGTLLAVDEYSRKGMGGVARSFESSYRQLSDSARLVLRRIGLSPTPTISTEAAAALAGLPVETVAASLEEMTDEALIEGRKHGRYYLHDLVRRYARSLADKDDHGENDEAVNRLLTYYWAGAAYADRIFTRQPPPQAVEPPASAARPVFADQSGGIEWAQTELANLLACVDYLSQEANGSDRHRGKTWLVAFASAMAGILRNDGLWRRSIALQTEALNMAGQLQAPLAEANALSERGFLYRLVSELHSAVADLERAITIYRRVGGSAGRTGEAHALDTYAVVLDRLGRRDEARRKFSQALSIYRGLNDRLGEANVLQDQGMLELFGDNPDGAVQLLSQSLVIYQDIDQPLGMAHAYGDLARAQRAVGADREAAGNLESARVQYLKLGNRLGANNALIQRGAALRRHDRGQAEAALDEAIRVSVRIGDRAGQVNALTELGELYLVRHRKRAALRAWGSALALARRHGLEREEDKLTDRISQV